MVSPVPSQSAIQTALGQAIKAVLPGVGVVEGQDNRVSEPASSSFVVFTVMRRERLSTNLMIYADCAFTGAVSGKVLTVSSVLFGSIVVGAPLFALTGATGVTIASLGTGTGGIGTYGLTGLLSLATGPLASGQVYVVEPVQVTMQLDFHAADPRTAADMVAPVETLFRSELANVLFASSATGVFPLYADDPRQVPFMNSEQQYETRWTLDCAVQVNQQIAWPMQFASALSATFVPAG